MSRLLVVVFVALAVFSRCLAGVAKTHQATCLGNADPLNKCKTVSCVPSKFGGTFVRQVGAFTAPTTAVSNECLWILRSPNEQTITKLQLRSSQIADGDILLFQDGNDVVEVGVGHSLDDINQKLHAFESRKLPALLVFLKNGKTGGTADSHFELDYEFA